MRILNELEMNFQMRGKNVLQLLIQTLPHCTAIQTPHQSSLIHLKVETGEYLPKNNG